VQQAFGVVRKNRTAADLSEVDAHVGDEISPRKPGSYSSHLPKTAQSGRADGGITWTLTPRRLCAAAAAPESVAALTAQTSPRKNTVTYPLPTFSQR